MTEDHEVNIEQTDEGYHLTCSACSWAYQASVAGPDKKHPDRTDDAFAVAVAERHYLSKNVWPWTDHGKPEVFDHDTQELKVINDWPFNK